MIAENSKAMGRVEFTLQYADDRKSSHPKLCRHCASGYRQMLNWYDCNCAISGVLNAKLSSLPLLTFGASLNITALLPFSGVRRGAMNSSRYAIHG